MLPGSTVMEMCSHARKPRRMRHLLVTPHARRRGQSTCAARTDQASETVGVSDLATTMSHRLRPPAVAPTPPRRRSAIELARRRAHCRRPLVDVRLRSRSRRGFEPGQERHALTSKQRARAATSQLAPSRVCAGHPEHGGRPGRLTIPTHPTVHVAVYERPNALQSWPTISRGDARLQARAASCTRSDARCRPMIGDRSSRRVVGCDAGAPGGQRRVASPRHGGG
jgi:hypothetical protein